MNAVEIRTVQDCMHQKLIWMEVHIYSVYRVYIAYKAKSQTGNIESNM